MNIADVIEMYSCQNTTDMNCLFIVSKDELSNIVYTAVCKALAEHKASFEASITNESKTNMLTTDDVCNILRVTKTTLWRWDKAKYLCPIKVGAKNMYKAEDIDALKSRL